MGLSDAVLSKSSDSPPARRISDLKFSIKRQPITSQSWTPFTATVAPAGIGTIEDRNRGYRLDISQKLPWCGKLDLRGKNVLAQARAAANNVDDVRLQLVESAKAALNKQQLRTALDKETAAKRPAAKQPAA